MNSDGTSAGCKDVKCYPSTHEVGIGGGEVQSNLSLHYNIGARLNYTGSLKGCI